MAGRIAVTRCVLDTSVVIKWFSESGEAGLEDALRLREGVLEGTLSVAVPSLLYYELANALRFNPQFAHGDVVEAVRSVLDMDFSAADVTADLLERAVETAFARGVTVYDACFLALAEAEGVALVTADEKLLARVRGAKHVIGLSKIRKAGWP